MFSDFNEIESFLLESKIKRRIVLCGAHDEAALTALVRAKRKGLVEGLLIGDEKEIQLILGALGEVISDYEIVHEPDEAESVRLGLEYVRSGQADIPMKGKIQTVSFIRALLNLEYGILEPGNLITHTTVFYYPPHKRFMFASDTSFAIQPNLDQKVKIINNAVKLARTLGFQDVNVGVLSAIESVWEHVPSTVDAQALSDMDWEDGVIVEGPFALDNALDERAAKHKGITKSIAGQADVLIVPDFLSGNILYKSLHYFGNLPHAGVVCGTVVPAVLPSRSDEPEAKYNAILVALVQSLKMKSGD